MPSYFEAIANLKDILAYCHVWGRTAFDIREKDDEVREVVEALDEEAVTISLRSQPEGAREDYGEAREYTSEVILSAERTGW